MSDITIFLPDGSPRTLPEGATATTVAEGIGPRLAKAARRRAGRRRGVGPRPPAARRGRGGDHHARHRGRAATSCATRRRTCSPRPSRSCSRAPSSRSARRSRTASTTTSTCPAGARSATTTSTRSRRGCARSSRPTSRSCAARCPRAEALALFADQPYKREIIERVTAASADDAARRRRGRRRRARSACTATRRSSSTCAAGPHVPTTSAARPLQADEGGRGVLAGRREGPDAAAHLRHGVGEQGRARRAPPPAGGGREARPPQARQRARPAQLPAGARRRPRRVAPEGRHRPQADGGLQPPAPPGRRLRVRLHAAPRQRQPVRDVRPPRLVRGRHVPADGDGQRHVLPEADELPDALPDLPVAASAATGSCRCGCSSWARCTATSGPARCTG